MKKIALLILVGLLILVFGVVPAWTSSLTRYIPSDVEIGTWDPVTRIYTLTTDVNDESIYIAEGNLTLDGDGHTITGSGGGYGVYLYQRSNVTVKNCVFSKFSIGIFLFIGSSNTLTNNITNDNSYGIFLNSGSSNTLTNNITNDNSYGIYLNSCSSNTLTKNTINNNQSAIKLYNCNLNKVYNNNFIDNPTQAVVNNSSGNEFYLDSPVGGNYWSNWTNPDDDGDYFVDCSYVFFYGRDDFPWICQDGWKRPLADAGDDKKVLVGETVQFDGSGSFAPSGVIGSYDWDFGGGNTGFGILVSYRYDIAGIYTVILTVTDDDLTDTDTAEITVQTPAEAIGDLITTIEDFGLPKGIEKSLIALLKAAIKSLEKYQEQAVIGQLTGFIHHVEAQNVKKLTEEQANTLIAAVQGIVNSIQ